MPSSSFTEAAIVDERFLLVFLDAAFADLTSIFTSFVASDTDSDDATFAVGSIVTFDAPRAIIVFRDASIHDLGLLP